MIKLVYITCRDADEAATIGKTLLDERLAACINIIDGMQSMYYWEGKLKEEEEAVLLVKTTAQHVEQIINVVRDLHSYDCPCIEVLPVEAGNPEYLQWVREETS